MKTEQVTFQPGEMIVREGEPGYVDGLCTVYVIEHGAAKVMKGGEEVAMLGPPEIIGEMSLYLDEPRSATVCAPGASTVPVKTMKIVVKSPEELAEKMPMLAARMMPQCAKRLRDTTAKLVEAEKRIKELEGKERISMRNDPVEYSSVRPASGISSD